MQAFTTDYSGRQVDVEFMQTVTKPASLIPLHLSWQSSPPKIVTGLQKMVQRYTVCLLTRLGDVLFDQTFGTTFWSDILRGAAQNSGQIQAAMAFANADVLTQMRSEDADTTTYGAIPEDERLAAAQLIGFTVDSNTGTFQLQIQLTSVQGDSYTYILPVTVARS